MQSINKILFLLQLVSDICLYLSKLIWAFKMKLMLWADQKSKYLVYETMGSWGPAAQNVVRGEQKGGAGEMRGADNCLINNSHS